jgi:hypothetical protein
MAYHEAKAHALGPAASSLGLTKERYCELVKSALSSADPTFATLGNALEDALRAYLPSRQFSTEVP